MLKNNTLLISSLAVLLLFAAGCTHDTLDDGDSADVIIEVAVLSNPAVTAALDTTTGACTFTVEDWTVEVANRPKNESVSGPFNDVEMISVNISYNWLDATPVFGNNYYRIRSIGFSGDVKISQVALVNIGKGYPAITVYPNPVINKTVSVQFSEMKQGVYQLRLVNRSGQVLFTRSVTHAGGNATQSLALPTGIATGNYQLEISRPGSKKTTISLFITE